MEFGAVIFAVGPRGFALQAIGALVITLVQKLTSENAPRPPPLVSLLQRHGCSGSLQNEAAGIGVLVLAHQVLGAAQHKGEILPGIWRNRVEQVRGLLVAAFDRGTGLDDRNRVVTDVM